MVWVTPSTTPALAAGSNRMPVMPASSPAGIARDACPSDAAVGRHEHPLAFGSGIDDVGIVGIDGHPLADLAVIVVRVGGDLGAAIERGLLGPCRALIGALEHVPVEDHVEDLGIAGGDLDFEDAFARAAGSAATMAAGMLEAVTSCVQVEVAAFQK